MLIPVFLSLIASSLAAQRGYSAPTPPGGGFGGGGSGSGGGYGGGCSEGQILRVDGSCVEPVVKRNVFDYDAPQEQVQDGPPPQITNPKKTYDVVIAGTPESPGIPIIFPSSQHKPRVYVLSKKGQIRQQVIDVPPGPKQIPEVFFVNYESGANPKLPGGVDLQTALASANAQQGQGGGGGGGGSV